MLLRARRKMDFVISELKLLYDQNSITGWFAEQNAMTGEWLLCFTTRANPSSPSYILDTRRKQRKEFKSLDAAINAVKEIGFDVKRISSC